MLRLISDEVRRVGHHFQTRGRGWYVLHIAGVFVLSVVIAGGMLWSQLRPVEASILTPLNNYRPKDFAMVQKDGLWHVYAIYVCISQTPACDTTARGLMHLTSKNLTDWTEEGYVIPPGAPGAWDSYDVWAPSVVEQGGTYYLFYTGVKENGSGVFEQKIGVATSTDLYAWTKSPSNPVLNCDNFSWAYWDAADNSGDGAACRDPNVVWNSANNEWVMTISGRSQNDVTPVAHPATIGIATSSDLLTWSESGYITQANGYVTESPHLVKHGATWHLFWTDNCTGGRCLKYSTSSSPYSGFSVKSNLLPAEANEYASEYYQLGSKEYFASVGNTNIVLSFKEILWTGTPFTLLEIPYGSIAGTVWDDADTDGVFDAGESGINSVSVTLYKDTGDDFFTPSTDMVYATATTGDDPDTVGTQLGFFGYDTVLPGTYWRSVQPSNYSAGNALENYSPTTGSSVKKIIVGDSAVITSEDAGFDTLRTRWDLLSSSLFTTSGLTLASGRAYQTVGTGTIDLASAQSIAFSRLQYFDADILEQGGAVRFLLSNDQGSTWKYWDGSSWATSDLTIGQSSTLSAVQANVLTLPEGNGMFRWRVLIQGSGSAPAYLFRIGVLTNRAPTTPTVVSPTSGQTVTAQPQLRFSSTDVEHEGIQFAVDVDTSSSFDSANLRQYTHTSSQFGWTGQDTANRTQYTDGTVATVQLASPLSPGTWYWRVTATDPSGANRPSSVSATSSFVIATPVTLGTVTVTPGTTSIAVRWTTNSSVTAFVQYGTTTAYGSSSTSSMGTEHNVTLSGLTAGTKYRLRVVADLGSGRTLRSADRLAQTNGTTISGVTVSTTTTTATVRWTTTDVAATKILFGKYGSTLNQSRTNKIFSRSHAITITGLTKGTRYQVRAVSIGMSSAQSEIVSFTTKTN